MFPHFFTKRKLKKQLGQYVRADVAEAMVEDQPIPGPKIQPGQIEFVFALIRADNPERLSEQLAVVVDMAMEHNAMVHAVLGPMVGMAFGTLSKTSVPPSARQELVGHLQKRLGQDIRMVHGVTQGHYGAFGSARRMSYTFIFPDFDKVLATLGRLESGQTREW